MVLKAEDSESSSATIPSKVPSNIASNIPSCRSLSSAEDGPGGHRSLPAGELARNLQDSVRHRILYLSEQLRVEKASRDENTVGYLKLVSKADRHQAPHIRQAFERVNQRASATIAQIERRLRRCHQQLQELQEGGRSRGFALKAKSSLDERKQPREKTPFSGPPKPGRADGPSAKLSDLVRHVPLESHFPASRPPKPPETKGAAQRRDLLLQKMKEGLEAARELPCSLQAAYQGLKEKHGTDLQASLVSLREEKCRQALLEEQVNEHLQRHLDEIYRLKQSLASAEEKMAYLSYERAKEIWEVMETFKDRISKLETLQRATPVEMMEPFRTHPQKFVFRCASLLLTLATAFLVLVSAVCACPPPLARARLRTCTALALIGLGALAWQKRHALPAADWRSWVPSGWRLYSKDSKPLSDGT